MTGFPSRARTVLLSASCALLASLHVSGGAAAQQFGHQPFGTPFGFGPSQPGMQQAAPSLVGAWSGQRQTQTGPTQHTDYFGQDGSFVSVVQLQNGALLRVWGSYRASPTGPGPTGTSQVRLDFQTQGWLPREICTVAPGMAPLCQPFQLPPSTASLVDFSSPDAFQAISVTAPDQGPILLRRDPNPVLLQRPVPQQHVVTLPYQPQQPMPSQPYVAQPGYRPYAPNDPSPTAGPRCDDSHARNICAINEGRLVSSGGCLVCVTR